MNNKPLEVKSELKDLGVLIDPNFDEFGQIISRIC